MPEVIAIEDDKRKLGQLSKLLGEYAVYIGQREKQPLAAQSVAMIQQWVKDNLRELDFQ
jgi:hypothetical protein